MISYYHPDHLGSTSYTSAGDQTLLQHERYFPFGERDTGDQEECDLGRPDNMRRSWIFNSKELDFDTGLYYFGARYYDPKTSVWQSADPILASYMGGKPSGGVWAPSNLSLYSYSWNNPVVFRDPDGRRVEWDAQKGATAKDVKAAQSLFEKAKNERNVDGSLSGSAARLRYVEADQSHTAYIHVGSKVQAQKDAKPWQSFADVVRDMTADPINYTNPRSSTASEPGVGSDVDINFNPYSTPSIKIGPNGATVARDPEASLANELGGHGFEIFGGLLRKSGSNVERWFQNEMPGASVENDNRAARHIPLRTNIGSDKLGWRTVTPLK
jgi:RHS repeat-associated protein